MNEKTLKRDIAILRQYNPEMTEEEAREHAIKQREIIARDLDRQRDVIETIHRIIPDATEAECGEIQRRLRFLYREDTTLKEWYDFESKVEAIAEQRRRNAEVNARLERLEAALAAHAAADAADHDKIEQQTAERLRKPKPKITIKQTAKIWDVSERTIQNWERGHGTPEEYCGRNITAVEMEQRAANYKSQKKMTTATVRYHENILSHNRKK